jgi:hypothetical protein
MQQSDHLHPEPLSIDLRMGNNEIMNVFHITLVRLK